MYGEGSSFCNNYSPDIDACDEVQSLTEYGQLYNWYAVDDGRGLCPSGWHVPTDGEWTELEDYITSQGFAGTESTALKSTSGWDSNGNGTDDFGFSALPGALAVTTLATSPMPVLSQFGGVRPFSGNGAWYRTLVSFYTNVYDGATDSRWGLSVRCLLDTPVQGRDRLQLHRIQPKR